MSGPPNRAPADAPLLLRMVAALPLGLAQAIGALGGRLAYLLSPRFRRMLRANAAEAGFPDIALANAAEVGKGVLELPAFWLRPHAEVLGWVRGVEGWEAVESALASGRGVVLVTPHFGAFEIIAQWIVSRVPLTVLYRPPKLVALEPAMVAGRSRSNMRPAPTDMSGVRLLVRALRAGEAIGLLPDQVPSRGEGEWADFFGRPAYTMTLAARLADKAGAPIFLAKAERLGLGKGFRVGFEALPDPLPGESAARRLNRALEMLIRRRPEQYLWAYNRYKVPAGAAPPDAGEETRHE